MVILLQTLLDFIFLDLFFLGALHAKTVELLCSELQLAERENRVSQSAAREVGQG